MKNSTITVRPMSAHTGAEILGIDLRQAMPDQTYLEIRAALNEWGAIFFRDQDITPEQQLSFARRFGPVKAPTHQSNSGSVEGYPEIKHIVRNPTDTRNVGGFWHTDLSYRPVPNYASVLYAKELPTHGGDTLFAHMGTAYDALSPGLRESLTWLSTVHIKANGYGAGDHPKPGVTPERYAEIKKKFAGLEASHPVIALHPETGRKLLYLSPEYSDRFTGWTREESLPLLQYLVGLLTRTENTCRFRWAEGSMAMWDNRAVVHFALDDYPGQRRAMHRTTVQGEWFAK